MHRHDTRRYIAKELRGTETGSFSRPFPNRQEAKTRPDKTRQDQTRPDKTRQDQTRPDKTRDQTRPDKTRQDQTRPDKTRQDQTGQNHKIEWFGVGFRV
jgi:hypothetical protein